jgi:hypothetical protein
VCSGARSAAARAGLRASGRGGRERARDRLQRLAAALLLPRGTTPPHPLEKWVHSRCSATDADMYRGPCIILICPARETVSPTAVSPQPPPPPPAAARVPPRVVCARGSCQKLVHLLIDGTATQAEATHRAPVTSSTYWLLPPSSRRPRSRVVLRSCGVCTLVIEAR